MRPELEHKVDLAIRLLSSIPQDCEIELSYSGGKDSDVIIARREKLTGKKAERAER